MLSKLSVEKALKHIIDPHLERDLISSKIVKKIEIKDCEIKLVLQYGYPISSCIGSIEDSIANGLAHLAPDLNLTLQINSLIARHKVQGNLKPIPNVKNIIAVGAGKGGVGKSTISANLALALASCGSKVGILDADIYGPSLPILFGIDGKPDYDKVDKKLLPIEKFGIYTMSIGFLVERQDAMIWRGPMVSSALQQLLNDTLWPELDYLIVDLPPGTGDIQLTLAQKVPVSGAVVVSTPQELACSDSRKAVNMFRKLGINLLGVIDNMSYFVCNDCGSMHNIFGEEGTKQLVKIEKTRLLGSLPLDQNISGNLDSNVSDIYLTTALNVAAELCLAERSNVVQAKVVST